jgi:GNAT superfamily N-acetyltransferase
MAFEVRKARLEDKGAIAPFTQGTFWWGDYVYDVFDEWLGDRRGRLLVAAGEDGTAVAVGRGYLTSPREAWVEGIRVRPDRRQEGIAAAITRDVFDWARAEGAGVARFVVEEGNTASMALARSLGMRAVSHWHFAERKVDAAPPAAGGNGGRRVPAKERLRPAHSSEAEPAFVSWRSGPLLRAGRGLFMMDWRWRTLDITNLRDAGKRRRLYASRAGWALVDTAPDRLEVGWLETGPDDAADFARALVDLGIEAGVGSLEVVVPSVAWLTTALEGAGCAIHPLVVWELPL